MKRLLMAVFVLSSLLPAAALEVRFSRPLPTDLGSGSILDTFLSEVTIEFVAKDTMAVAYGGGVALINVIDGSVEVLPVGRSSELPSARFVLDQEIKDERFGVFTFVDSTANEFPWPSYAYNIATGQLCDLSSSAPSERRACFGGLESYFEVESPWQDERAFAADFQLYRVNAVSAERTLLYEKPMRDLFGRRFSRKDATLVDYRGTSQLLVLAGAPGGTPHVLTLQDDSVSDLIALEEAEGRRNAFFVGDSHAAVLVDGEVYGDEMIYEVAIIDFDGNRVAELEELRVFDMRQYMDVSADGRWLAVFGYHTERQEQGLFLYEILYD